jgi:hypothetical protein
MFQGKGVPARTFGGLTNAPLLRAVSNNGHMRIQRGSNDYKRPQQFGRFFSRPVLDAGASKPRAGVLEDESDEMRRGIGRPRSGDADDGRLTAHGASFPNVDLDNLAFPDGYRVELIERGA